MATEVRKWIETAGATHSNPQSSENPQTAWLADLAACLTTQRFTEHVLCWTLDILDRYGPLREEKRDIYLTVIVKQASKDASCRINRIMGFRSDDSALGLLGQKAPVKAEKQQETGKEI